MIQHRAGHVPGGGHVFFAAVFVAVAPFPWGSASWMTVILWWWWRNNKHHIFFGFKITLVSLNSNYNLGGSGGFQILFIFHWPTFGDMIEFDGSHIFQMFFFQPFHHQFFRIKEVCFPGRNVHSPKALGKGVQVFLVFQKIYVQMMSVSRGTQRVFSYICEIRMINFCRGKHQNLTNSGNKNPGVRIFFVPQPIGIVGDLFF